jgi:hypothetical protein
MVTSDHGRPSEPLGSALDVAGKLIAIEKNTAVPYRILSKHSDRPGELGLARCKCLADAQKTI